MGIHAEDIKVEIDAIRERLFAAKGGPMHSVNCAYLPRDVDRLLAIVEAYGHIVEPALRAFAQQDFKDDFGARVSKGCKDLADAVKMFNCYGIGKARFVGPLPPWDSECDRASLDHPVELLNFRSVRMLDMGESGLEVFCAGSILISEAKQAQMVACRLDDWAERRGRKTNNDKGEAHG